MAKKYTADEIMKMAVGLLPEDPAADMDLDGKITSWDARYTMREDAGLVPIDDAPRMTENALNRILKSADENFSYNPDTDPLYNHYRRTYEKESSLAAEDLMGKSAALTGGYGNSYAAKIASDLKQDYSELLADKGAELEERAYKRHRDSVDELYRLYGILADEEKRLDDKKKAALDFAVTASNLGDDSFIEALGIDPSDSDFRRLKERAEFFAEYGDYSGLASMGINTTNKVLADVLEKGELFAKYGDYSILESFGFDGSSLKNEDEYELAELFAKYGDYSLLKKLGVNTSNKETEEYYDRLLKKQKVW